MRRGRRRMPIIWPTWIPPDFERFGTVSFHGRYFWWRAAQTRVLFNDLSALANRLSARQCAIHWSRSWYSVYRARLYFRLEKIGRLKVIPGLGDMHCDRSLVKIFASLHRLQGNGEGGPIAFHRPKKFVSVLMAPFPLRSEFGVLWKMMFGGKLIESSWSKPDLQNVFKDQWWFACVGTWWQRKRHWMLALRLLRWNIEGSNVNCLSVLLVNIDLNCNVKYWRFAKSKWWAQAEENSAASARLLQLIGLVTSNFDVFRRNYMNQHYGLRKTGPWLLSKTKMRYSNNSGGK